MQIGGLQKLSLSDFPSCPAAVVFTRGCNYACWYCHNRELLRRDRPCLQVRDVLHWLEQRRGRIRGVTVTGGEPTLQVDLPDFLAACRSMDFRIKLDSNGSRPKMVQRLLQAGLLDYCAVDLKLPPDLYGQLGAENGMDVLSTIQLLSESGLPFEVRTTVIPQIRTPELREMAASCPPLPAFILQPYAAAGRIVTPLSTLRQLADAVQDLQPHVRVRGH